MTLPFLRSKHDLKSKALAYSESSLKGFLKKKIPRSDKYPFEVHDPELVVGEGAGYEKLYLVGDNWIDDPELPIVVAVGCNDWKLGFVSDYLPGFRVAFLPRKKVGLDAVRILIGLKVKPEVVMIWGYTEKYFLNRYLKNVGCQVWRIEDGFVRSSELGAKHSTPYSLVIDRSGFYYNCYGPSDIENILKSTDFSNIDELDSRAEYAMGLMKRLEISKYNPPILQREQSVRLKKRILVIGQVDGDASIKHGNPDGWNSEELIKLAYYENPGAEIIYRPHPEVYRGFQKSAFKKKRIEKLAIVSSPDVDVISCIKNSDHVYTITSLTGLEALIRGKVVTVVGAPFYSGWGLTDDRVDIPRRGRKLTLNQLFYAAYVIYPKYLGSLSNSYIGLLATCYRIAVDRDFALSEYAKRLLDGSDDNRNSLVLRRLAKTSRWPLFFVENKIKNSPQTLSGLLRFVDHRALLSPNTGDLYRKLLPYFILGCVGDNKGKDEYLLMIRGIVDFSCFNNILLDLNKYFPGEYLVKHWAWLFSQSEDADSFHGRKILHDTFGWRNDPSERSVSFDANISPEVVSTDCHVEIFHPESCAAILETLEGNIIDRDLSEVEDKIKYLLLSGTSFFKVIKACATVSDLLFDFPSMASFAKLVRGVDPLLGNRYGPLTEFRSLNNSGASDREVHLLTMCNMLAFRQDKLEFALMQADKFSDYLASEDRDIIVSQVFMDVIPNSYLVQAYLTLENYDKAEKMARRVLERNRSEPSENDVVKLSQALSYNGKLDEAITMMDAQRQRNLSSPLVVESMRLYVLKGLYKASLMLMYDALARGIFIGEMHRRKAYFGNGMIREAFETFTEIGVCQSVAKYYKNKYYNFDVPAASDDRFFLLSIFGPGDEIRFASIYSKLLSYLDCGHVAVACSPRLYDLFSRSFPSLEFVPVARPRNSDKVDLDNYTSVPGSDIVGVMDNNAVAAIDRSDSILFVTDFLHRLLPTKDAFSGSRYLISDEEMVRTFDARIPDEKLTVGLSWRSSLSTSARNEHYLSIEQLAPLFDIPGVQFVNLQYDDCQDELEWVESNYPGKIIDFDDIDQYNDFDSVSALMSCMDLVISPATTVAELSGALGCTTWLFSNSSEIDWRKKDTTGIDVWHNSVVIVDVDTKGDKEKLVAHLREKLLDFVSEFQVGSSVSTV
ncbi:hypothetical protein [Cobetia amphilecti]|uniref:capsular polysaccharide export protein, LipB/KpsS family n=1 Tax=Cobetia amphilecti TaxID=1055104 RepID=UPI00329A7BAD